MLFSKYSCDFYLEHPCGCSALRNAAFAGVDPRVMSFDCAAQFRRGCKKKHLGLSNMSYGCGSNIGTQNENPGKRKRGAGWWFNFDPYPYLRETKFDGFTNPSQTPELNIGKCHQLVRSGFGARHEAGPGCTPKLGQMDFESGTWILFGSVSFERIGQVAMLCLAPWTFGNGRFFFVSLLTHRPNHNVNSFQAFRPADGSELAEKRRLDRWVPHGCQPQSDCHRIGGQER